MLLYFLSNNERNKVRRKKKNKKNAIWILKVELKIVSLKKRKEISWKQPEKDNKVIIEIIIKSKKI